MTRTHLPALLDEIAGAIAAATGDRAQAMADALAIASVKGGQRVWIPARPAPDHWLVTAVGQRAADVLGEHFRGGGQGAMVDLPLGPSGSYQQQRINRQRAYRAAVDNGLSLNQIARAVGVTRRSAIDARQKLRHGRSNAVRDLFGED